MINWSRTERTCQEWFIQNYKRKMTQSVLCQLFLNLSCRKCVYPQSTWVTHILWPSKHTSSAAYVWWIVLYSLVKRWLTSMQEIVILTIQRPAYEWILDGWPDQWKFFFRNWNKWKKQQPAISTKVDSSAFICDANVNWNVITISNQAAYFKWVICVRFI